MGPVRLVRGLHLPRTFNIRRLSADFTHLPPSPIASARIASAHIASATFVKKTVDGRTRFLLSGPTSANALRPRDPQALSLLLRSYVHLMSVADETRVNVEFQRVLSSPPSPYLSHLSPSPSLDVEPFQRLDDPGMRGCVVGVERENVKGGGLRVLSSASSSSSAEPYGGWIHIDLDPGDMCLYESGCRVLKDEARPWDVDFDAWEDFIVIRSA